LTYVPIQEASAEYVNMFLKLKHESIDYSSWVQSEANKSKYIEDYCRAEGIALDKILISKNERKSTFAKLKLNWTWEK